MKTIKDIKDFHLVKRVKSVKELPIGVLKDVLSENEIRELHGLREEKSPSKEELSSIVKNYVSEISEDLKGEDGKSPSKEELSSIVKNYVSEISEDLKGEDGKSPSKEELDSLIEEALETVFEEINPIVDFDISQDQKGLSLNIKKANGEEDSKPFNLSFQNIGRSGGGGGAGTSRRIRQLEAEVDTLQTQNENSVLYFASIAPSTGTYTGDQLTLLTYDDFLGITNHTKELTYTGEELTSTQEIFLYEGTTWTVDITLTYSSGVWQTKNINISKV
tara:strand:+ start:25381 stop:26208 length:828 start_codon:yes stop_codon:yes gene_type:complete